MATKLATIPGLASYVEHRVYVEDREGWRLDDVALIVPCHPTVPKATRPQRAASDDDGLTVVEVLAVIGLATVDLAFWALALYVCDLALRWLL